MKIRSDFLELFHAYRRMDRVQHIRLQPSSSLRSSASYKELSLTRCALRHKSLFIKSNITPVPMPHLDASSRSQRLENTSHSTRLSSVFVAHVISSDTECLPWASQAGSCLINWLQGGWNQPSSPDRNRARWPCNWEGPPFRCAIWVRSFTMSAAGRTYSQIQTSKIE
jgi:hypothetical protein